LTWREKFNPADSKQNELYINFAPIIIPSIEGRIQVSGGLVKKTILFSFLIAVTVLSQPVQKNIIIDTEKQFQTIDGFGVNINPAQWHKGSLKPVIDRLMDDLGATLFRFDCYGTADWLDPAKRGINGRYPETYLQEIYSNKFFKDAWETFRYLNAKGIEPFFNVSGKIPAALAGEDGQTLVDFDGYTEMVVTMLEWARNQEKLRFSLLEPFNETDLGFPEGPRLPARFSIPVVKSIINRLDKAGMSDIKLILLGDSSPNIEKLQPILDDPALLPYVTAFATHTYGDGDEGDGGNWFTDESSYARFVKAVRMSPYRDRSVWLSEYGDLDQSGAIEYAVSWRSTRRLMRNLSHGFSAGIFWDAFDNFHEHDQAWSTYGLFATDREKDTYEARKRYYAAKMIYRFVKPGFRRVNIELPPLDPQDVYRTWHDPLRHMRLLAFVSPDGSDLTLVALNRVESDVTLNVTLKGPVKTTAKASIYCTSATDNCAKVSDIQINKNSFQIKVPANVIYTLTTVQ
jgi:O-glycosyl hydrolase